MGWFNGRRTTNKMLARLSALAALIALVIDPVDRSLKDAQTANIQFLTAL